MTRMRRHRGARARRSARHSSAGAAPGRTHPGCGHLRGPFLSSSRSFSVPLPASELPAVACVFNQVDPAPHGWPKLVGVCEHLHVGRTSLGVPCRISCPPHSACSERPPAPCRAAPVSDSIYMSGRGGRSAALSGPDCVCQHLGSRSGQELVACLVWSLSLMPPAPLRCCLCQQGRWRACAEPSADALPRAPAFRG